MPVIEFIGTVSMVVKAIQRCGSFTLCVLFEQVLSVVHSHCSA